MRQYQSHKGSNILEIITDYSSWGLGELGHAFLGLLWISFLLAFIAFWYHYNRFYRLGVL